jgi:hypothetical protein
VSSVAKVPAGRSKVFRHYDPTQSFLLPPSLDGWLPEDHTARFIADAEINALIATGRIGGPKPGALS